MSEQIIKSWGDKGSCEADKVHRNHWAFYVFEDEADKEYWTAERIDEENKAWWRHYEFMSIPCHHCGAYSPLRCDNAFHSGPRYEERACKKEGVINHRPDDKLPDTLAYYSENGWTYIYFRKTLSDSLDGQETFRLRCDPPEVKCIPST